MGSQGRHLHSPQVPRDGWRQPNIPTWVILRGPPCDVSLYVCATMFTRACTPPLPTLPGTSQMAIVSSQRRACSWSHCRQIKVLRDGVGVSPSHQAQPEERALPARLPALGETAQAVQGEGALQFIVAVACEYREAPGFRGHFHLFHKRAFTHRLGTLLASAWCPRGWGRGGGNHNKIVQESWGLGTPK